MMTEIPIKTLKVISPMFSHGNNDKLEPRPTELKGLLRNTYRIANPYFDSKTLYQHEVERFGGQLKENGEELAKPSPLRIQILDLDSNKESWYEEKFLLFHKKSPKRLCYKFGKVFNVKFETTYSYLKQWYEDLINLALLIGGIGKRTRRGRGCMTTDELSKISYEDLPEYTVKLLNNVCEKKAYVVNGERDIILQNPSDNDKPDNDRPYIKKIHFGSPLLKKTKDCVKEYLKKVDFASHNTKLDFRNSYVLGDVDNGFHFASSVIVSLAEVNEGIVPVYTFLNFVPSKKFENKPKNQKNGYNPTKKQDNEKTKWDNIQDAFVDKIEKGDEK
ncbi:RAMP superfamily CRISPR-associated protein [[Clostridium] cellulosi]|nr:MAG: hypothetical protein DIU81_07960 [[Clostridium] cellulosi]